ncbi:MAG: glycoside hydrolase family 18 protein, partial [Acutalibacteraceae bacterium]
FYSQNTVQDYRMCAFDDVTTQKIKLEVSQADNTFKLREIEFYELEAKNRSDFRVSDYVIMPDLVNESFYDKNSDRYFAPENCKVINQVHVIAAAKWNDNGELVISDGATPKQLKKIVKKLRAYFGDNEVDIFATVFFNACDPDTVFSEHKEEVIENTVDFLLKYGFDGVSYDWEYPTKAQWPVFSEHLVNLKKELSKHDLKLSCAFSAFNCSLSQDAIKALDQIEIMSYDNFDNDGNHSSFTSGAVQPVEYFLGLGFDAKQLNLGVPFYARPTDGSGVWIDYDDESYTPSDRFQNFSNGMWFNSAQMIQDKTAYAIEKDLGGMMIFTSTEDIDYNNELSLLKSMKNTIDERIVQK